RLLILILMIQSKIKSAPFSPIGAGALTPSMAFALRAPSACKSAVLPICPPLRRGSESEFQLLATTAVPSPAQRGKVADRPEGGRLLILILMIQSKIKSAPFSPFGAGALTPSMAFALRAPSACKSAVLPICPPLRRGSESEFQLLATTAVPSPAQRGKVADRPEGGRLLILILMIQSK